MTEDEEKEYRAHQRYAEFRDHFDRFLHEECGASENESAAIGRYMVWWASVLARANKWLIGFVVVAFTLSSIGLAASMGVRSLMGLR